MTRTSGPVRRRPLRRGLLALIAVWRSGARSTAWFVVGVVALATAVLVGLVLLGNGLLSGPEYPFQAG